MKSIRPVPSARYRLPSDPFRRLHTFAASTSVEHFAASLLIVLLMLCCSAPALANQLSDIETFTTQTDGALDLGDTTGSGIRHVMNHHKKPAQDFSVRHTHENKTVIALVLGGGGTRGAAHVGVLKVLEKNRVPFDLVVGTSMGAIVGGFYCAGVPIPEIEKMFRKRTLMRSYMSVALPVRIVSMPFFLMPRLVYHPYDGLYWGFRFRRFLNRSLPDGEKNIEDLKMPFAAVAVDLAEGRTHSITAGRLSRAMLASSAVPGLRKPIEIGERLYVDGGVLENIPVEQAEDLGADVVIAVNCDEVLSTEPLKTFRKMGSVSKRMVTLQLEHLDAVHVNKACVTIHPDVTGIGLLSTKKSDAVRAMEAGETAARQALPQIRNCLNDIGVKF